MNIQKRSTLLYTSMTAGVLIIFMSLIYYAAYQNRKSEFYNILIKEGIIKANLLLNTELDASTLQTIYRQNRALLYEVEVAIYDSRFNLVYHDAVDIDFVKETPQMLEDIANKGKISFVQEDWQVIGTVLENEGEKYIITAAAYDEYGYTKLRNNLVSMVISFFIVLLIIYAVGIYFSKKSLQPVSEMIYEARKISASSLDLRLKEGSNTDELGQLAMTFNDMLERLEKSFEAQKQFVSYIAHELRTPLSAIIAELELSKTKNRSSSEYRKLIDNVLWDAKKMAKFSGSLLDFAKASYDRSEVHFESVRIDEVLIDASRHAQNDNNDYKVELDFLGEFNEEEITCTGNSYLLIIAFSNLIENACKYSQDKTCRITITKKSAMISIHFKDNGIGILPDEIGQVFNTFFRGSNQGAYQGSGIGLTLVQKIIQLHQGKISIQSTRGQGSEFTVDLDMQGDRPSQQLD